MDFFKTLFRDDLLSPKPRAGANPARRNPKSSPWTTIGDFFRTLSARSETMIQTVRRDLEVFGSFVKNESAGFRDAVGRSIIGQVIEEFGSSVWRGTAGIFSHGREAILSVDRDRYRRLLRERSDGRTRSKGFESESREEDFEAWRLGFWMEEMEEEIEEVIRSNSIVEVFYREFVPHVVDHETFWSRYFYGIHKIIQAENARRDLAERPVVAYIEEDLSQEVDGNNVEWKDEISGIEGSKRAVIAYIEEDLNQEVDSNNVESEDKISGVKGSKRSVFEYAEEELSQKVDGNNVESEDEISGIEESKRSVFEYTEEELSRKVDGNNAESEDEISGIKDPKIECNEEDLSQKVDGDNVESKDEISGIEEPKTECTEEVLNQEVDGDNVESKDENSGIEVPKTECDEEDLSQEVDGDNVEPNDGISGIEEPKTELTEEDLSQEVDGDNVESKDENSGIEELKIECTEKDLSQEVDGDNVESKDVISGIGEPKIESTVEDLCQELGKIESADGFYLLLERPGGSDCCEACSESSDYEMIRTSDEKSVTDGKGEAGGLNKEVNLDEDDESEWEKIDDFGDEDEILVVDLERH